MTSSFADRLRIETRALHIAVERGPYMAALLRGQVDRAGYVLLLRQLLAIYAALETALQRHAGRPSLAPFDFEALARTQALQDDLAALGAAPALHESELLPAGSAYVARLRSLDVEDPDLLLAHAYVRYLGDLSGGQILRRIVRQSLHLSSTAGTSFYEFGHQPDIREQVQAFRLALDRARFADADAIVAEARQAFERHADLFDELARCPGASVLRPS